MSLNQAMLEDIKRREINNQLAKLILGLDNSYTPVNTNWKKFKVDLVKVSNGNTFDAH